MRMSRSSKDDMMQWLRWDLRETRRKYIDVMADIFCVYDANSIPIYLRGIESSGNDLSGGFFSGEKDGGESFIELGTLWVEDCFTHCDTCWQNYLDHRSYTFSHEMGHYFHFLVNPSQASRRVQDKGKFGISWFVNEMIAELGGFRFFDRIDSSYKRPVFFPIKKEVLYVTGIRKVASEYFRRNYWNIDDKISKLSRLNSEAAAIEFSSYEHLLGRETYVVDSVVQFDSCAVEGRKHSFCGERDRQLTLFDKFKE